MYTCWEFERVMIYNAIVNPLSKSDPYHDVD